MSKDLKIANVYFMPLAGKDKTNILDLGFSQGSLLKTIKDFNDQTITTKYIGVDYNSDFKKHWDKLEEKKPYI